jgi:hypothetical protein
MYVVNTGPSKVNSTSCAATVRFQATPLAARPTLRRPRPSIQLIAGVQTVGGIISLLNDFLISKKRHPLGFLNPWLYRPDGLTRTRTRASKTLYLALVRAVARVDSPPSLDGILFVLP